MAQFENLVDSSAYLIYRAHDSDLDAQLGKTKLFKMLYLASWWAYRAGEARLYDGPWYRIDLGPALMSGDWDLLKSILSDRYEINSERVARWPGYLQVLFSKPTVEPESTAGFEYRKFLDEAFEKIIELTANEAAEMTYDTDPMNWMVAEERASWGDSTQYREFKLDDEEREKFLELARKYAAGRIEIPDLVQRMGRGWTLNRVVVYLDTFGLFRSSDLSGLSESGRSEILEALLRRMGDEKMVSQSVDERAVASSRIEEEYVSPDSVIE